MHRRRVIILADRSRPQVAEVLAEVRALLDGVVDVVGELDADDSELSPGLAVDVAVAIGGDGTLIGQARRLVDRGIPLVGVNVGRLGFLAEFDVRSLREHLATVLGANAPYVDHMVLEVRVERNGAHRAAAASEVRASAGGKASRADALAVNDFVMTAGPPFRMIEIRCTIDGSSGPTMSGDGVIVATPTGSTAYSVSAGGPIVHPAVEAMVITPLAAHSLAFRPIVIGADCHLEIDVLEANEGTTLIADGQVTAQLRAGDRVSIRRHPRRARFIAHPKTSYWGILLDKMRWAVPPKYSR